MTDSKIKISPSVLACDFSHFEDEVKKAELAGAEYLHLDVMDGVFVPNISFGWEIIKSIRKHSNAVFDVHLMIVDPIRYVEKFRNAGADIITVHYESCDNIIETLKKIRELGAKAGITIKPKTPASVLEPLLEYADMILIMTVEPGFGGQKFIPETVASIETAARLISESGRDIDLEVDGGITPENVYISVDAGANVIVAGSAVFRADDVKAAVQGLKNPVRP